MGGWATGLYACQVDIVSHMWIRGRYLYRLRGGRTYFSLVNNRDGLPDVSARHQGEHDCDIGNCTVTQPKSCFIKGASTSELSLADTSTHRHL